MPERNQKNKMPDFYYSVSDTSGKNAIELIYSTDQFKTLTIFYPNKKKINSFLMSSYDDEMTLAGACIPKQRYIFRQDPEHDSVHINQNEHTIPHWHINKAERPISSDEFNCYLTALSQIVLDKPLNHCFDDFDLMKNKIPSCPERDIGYLIDESNVVGASQSFLYAHYAVEEKENSKIKIYPGTNFRNDNIEETMPILSRDVSNNKTENSLSPIAGAAMLGMAIFGLFNCCLKSRKKPTDNKTKKNRHRLKN